MQRSRGGEACWHALLVAAGVKDVAAQQAAAAAAHARVAHPELLDGQADGAAGVGVHTRSPSHSVAAIDVLPTMVGPASTSLKR